MNCDQMALQENSKAESTMLKNPIISGFSKTGINCDGRLRIYSRHIIIC